MLRIDRTKLSVEEADILDGQVEAVATRRELLRQAGRCINGPLEGVVGKRGAIHGPANTKSGKCDRCERVAKEGR